MRTLMLATLSFAVFASACGDDDSSTSPDAGAADAAPLDAAGADAAPTDVGATDATTDAATTDAATTEAGATDAATTDAGATDAAPRATVLGTITLPAATSGKAYGVRILSVAGVPGAVPVGQATGVTAGATLQYAIPDVPPGTYFVLGFVDVDGSGGESSTPGDFAGWYGHTGDGNPPGAPNAVVPASGAVRFDFSLVLR